MTLKDYILIASLIANGVLGYWLYSVMSSDASINEALLKSQGRVEALELERDVLILEMDSLTILGDSLSVKLEAAPKERIVIVKQKDESISNLPSLSIDSNFRYLARRLSEVNLGG